MPPRQRAGLVQSGWARTLFRLRSGLLSSYHDNMIYRHEIGMDNFSRLRRGSSVVHAHYFMFAVLGAVAVSGALFRWRGLMAGSGMALFLAFIGTYPVAMLRAFRSIHRERVTGALEQLYMTRLSHLQLFEGKFFGVLAPFLEARRYLILLGLAFVVSVAFAVPGPLFIAALVAALIVINHYGFSAYVGVLSGLRRSARASSFSFSFVRDWDLNPWPHHLWVLLRAAAALSVPLAFLYFATVASDLSWGLYFMFLLMLLAPGYASVQLREREAVLRDRLAKNFRMIFSFEPA